ncbi:metal-dependent transcriptional regulator [Desulforhopalus sp. IMCC35007]|uniref:metal-dependent transcriptional regulator n=1 Tax=Desulforhopalus sp. IMCC35007 TaxID=2569543 RepID=UPI0010AE023D|nr:metal-dependent transcriptional regulator [Desulforhopalus sp. IMCC35007]TKB07334.1 metal-dependent transcriptional regulator [Desulforhopalus sp. IMCC35007]
MQKNAVLTASQEDYLEAIYQISADKMAARAKDIANFLDVKASSVTGALRTLSSFGLVNYAPYDLITLTKEGKAVAEEIVRRHLALQEFLVSVLGVDAKEADEAACKMEHSVPKNIVDRFIQYADYVKRCPKGGITWDSGFGYYCKHGCTQEEGCSHCKDGCTNKD